jgi:plasmid stabilization system protein ParE
VTRKFVYSLEAQAELREIVRHTARQWGAARARSYARQIDEAAGDLATGQGFFKDWGQLLPGLRVKAVGSHFVFCVIRPGRPALVLAILHQRVDLMTRLKDRLV